MTTTAANFDADFTHRRSPVRAAAVLLGIYIGMYLAVGGMIRAVESTEAVAAVVWHRPAQLPTIAASMAASVSRDETSAADLPHEAIEPADNSRECAPGDGIDSQCIYN